MGSSRFLFVRASLFALTIASVATWYTPAAHASGLYEGLVGYWSFDSADMSGTTVYDLSGYGNNGTRQNNPAVVAGKFGEALSFNGNNQRVTISGLYSDEHGLNAPLQIQGPITLGAWVKLNTTSGNQSIIERGYTTSPNREMVLRVAAPGYQINSWNGSNHGASYAVPSGDVGQWVHIVGTYDGTKWSLYRNGVLVSETTDAQGAVTTTLGWAIGATGGSPERYFNGSIDEVVMYDRALAPDEVQLLYTRPSPPAPSTPTIQTVTGYTPAPFDEYPLPVADGSPSNGSGTSINDLDNYAQPLLPYATPAAVSAAWYDGTPSPQTCYSVLRSDYEAQGQGKCLYIGDERGARIAAITATPAFAGFSTIGAGIDLVSIINGFNTGAYNTWAYVPVSPATQYVPKYTPVDVRYACQPSQTYMWASYQNYSLGLWAYTMQQRIFRFADRAKINGTTAGALFKDESRTVSGTETLTLECGGYRPEAGTQVGIRPRMNADGFSDTEIDDFFINGATAFAVRRLDDLTMPTKVSYPPFYGMDRITAQFGSSAKYWPWTWAYYNAADASYYHPPVTLTLQACSGNNEIVVNNVCVACPAGQYRAGNSCTTSPPPSATIDAGAGSGVRVAVAANTPLTITATYQSGSSGSTATTTTFSASGNWIVPSGISSTVVADLWGGGGGGAGDGGSYNPGSVGGASTFNTTLRAGGGAGGLKDAGGGGAGGTASGGDTNTSGAAGNPGAGGTSGKGGNAPNGGAGGAALTSNNPGNVGTAPGGGGGGACSGSSCGSTGGGGGGSGAYAKKTYPLGFFASGASIPVVVGSGGTGGSGNQVGGVGGQGRVTLAYTAVADPITATAINDDATGSTVPCAQVVGDVSGNGNANCQAIPDTTKTYTFQTATPGTYTFSAQMTTASYSTYNSYATVTVEVCAVGQVPGSGGQCVVADLCTNNAEFPGSQTTVPANCVQNPDTTCSAAPGYVISGGQCIVPAPANLNLQAQQARVRNGESPALYWTGENLPGTCTLARSPSSAGFPQTVASSPTGSSATVSGGPVTQPTLFTLSCGTAQDTQTITLVPVFEEI